MTRYSKFRFFLVLLSLLLIPHASSLKLTSNNVTNTTAGSILSSHLRGFHSNASMCERLYNLPRECDCTEPAPLSAVISCTKSFQHEYFNDTIGMKINLLPCDPEGSKLTVDITERDHGIDYTVAGVKAGETKNIPIPGLSIIVPTIGHLGVDVSVYIGGNIDSLRLKVGLNACAVLGDHHSVCASSVPGLNTILPFWVLKGTYSFGNVCKNSTTMIDSLAMGATTIL